jgi:hypothetical protein
VTVGLDPWEEVIHMVLLDLQRMEVRGEQDVKIYSCSSVVDLDCASYWSGLGDC